VSAPFVGPPLADVLLEAISGARSDAELTALWERFSDVWTDRLTAAVRVRLAELGQAAA
jgi:hypothetical protein